MDKLSTKRLVLSGLFLALGLLMPFLTVQIPNIGSRLLPMHIPVLLCGFICGWPYGLIIGLVLPVFEHEFGMRDVPTAVAMASSWLHMSMTASAQITPSIMFPYMHH